MGDQRVFALRKEFSNISFAIEDDETAEKCASLCAEVGLEPEGFVSKWELYYLNTQIDGGQVLKRDLDGFKQFLEKERVELFRMKQTGYHFFTKNDLNMLLNDKEEPERDDKPLQRTPLKKKSTPSSYIDPDELTHPPLASIYRCFSLHTPADVALKSSNTPFARRANKFSVQFTFNDHLFLASSEEAVAITDGDDVLKRLKPVRRCELDIVGTGPESGTRYMFDQIENKSGAVDRRIQNFAKVLEDRLHRKVDIHVALASQEKVTVVGRLCCEGEGHLNYNSVLLEGGVKYLNGQRVRLDLRNIRRFSFFPGQVVGVEGQNPSGFCLVATRIFDSIALPSSSSLESGKPAAKRRISIQEPSIPESPQFTRIVAAAGPFTTSENLAYEPLVELFAYARKVRPNLLILMGPFVDSEHSQIKQGAVGRLLSHVYQEEIRMRVEKYCDDVGEGCRVVLIPSHRDAHHDLIFPQVRFDRFPVLARKLCALPVFILPILCASQESHPQHLHVVFKLLIAALGSATEPHVSSNFTIPNLSNGMLVFFSLQPPLDANDFEDPNHQAAKIIFKMSRRESVPFLLTLWDILLHSMQILLLPNPGILKVDEVTAGFCTTDILRHLSSEEVSRVPQGASSDRMTRLASHLLAQRSFYPLFPPAQSTPLDLTIAPGLLDLPWSPDILLLSSNLAPFVKVVTLPVDVQSGDGNTSLEEADKVTSVCINPGYIARGMSGGTFTEICFSSTVSSSELEPLHKRLHVKVIRI